MGLSYRGCGHKGIELQPRKVAQTIEGTGWKQADLALLPPSDLLLVPSIGQTQPEAGGQRSLGDAVHSFLVQDSGHRMGQRRAKNGLGRGARRVTLAVPCHSLSLFFSEQDTFNLKGGEGHTAH